MQLIMHELFVEDYKHYRSNFYENRFIGNYSKFNAIDYGKKMPYLNGKKWSK